MTNQHEQLRQQQPFHHLLQPSLQINDQITPPFQQLLYQDRQSPALDDAWLVIGQECIDLFVMN